MVPLTRFPTPPIAIPPDDALTDKLSPAGDSLSVKASSGGIAIGGVGNRVSGTIVAGGDAGHASMCRSCPYRKWGEKLRKQGLIIPGVE